MKNKITRELFPFLNWWPLVNKYTLRYDIGAGITNAIIVLPQGVAFAMIAGLPPIYGLYTAIIPPIIAALYGSSWHLISGPTTSISLVFFAALSQFAHPGTDHFIALAFVMTFLAGLIQFAMGLARMGNLVNFVSNSVVVGFTAGAALLIATSQLKNILGIMPPQNATFYHEWEYFINHINQTNFYVLGIAIATLISAISLKLLSRKIRWLPNLLLAMIIGSLIAYYFANGVDGVKLVGKLSATLPQFQVLDLSMANIKNLFPQAFAVALLGLIQAISISRAVASKSQQQLDVNQEFIGNGLSNIVGSMFSCYASSGSFTRTGINYEAGAKTPMSAIFAATSLALILLFIAPFTAFLPIAAMGGIILLVAYNLVDFKQIKQISKSSKKELGVLVVTFLSTLFLHLEFAIYIGILLSLILYLQSSAKPRIVNVAPMVKNNIRQFRNSELNDLDECPQLKILRIDGSMFFAAIEHVRKKLEEINQSGVHHILIIATGINIIDISGAELLINFSDKLKKSGGCLYLCTLNKTVRDFLAQGEYDKKFGRQNIFVNKETAIPKIYQRLKQSICDDCQVKIFIECNQ